ncbi:MAG: hypothetical protein WDN28_00610 [Chthoniobacter sp.]
MSLPPSFSGTQASTKTWAAAEHAPDFTLRTRSEQLHLRFEFRLHDLRLQ